ncbi:MAG: hypothetical protein K1X82_01195 [Bacteroidia bacterium]|nr:hypothetical protein [Bacteroidia bacterium]
MKAIFHSICYPKPPVVSPCFWLWIFTLVGCGIAEKKINSSNADVSMETTYHWEDSVRTYLSKTAMVDSLESAGFYGDFSPYSLFLVKSGFLFSKKEKNTLFAYSISDSAILVRNFLESNGKWKESSNSINLPIHSFSPAYFRFNIEDYNFDHRRDIFLQFYQSMGNADSYGYLLIFDEDSRNLVLVKESIEIPNLVPDSKHKLLKSTRYSNPNSGEENYSITEIYSWEKNALVKVDIQNTKFER